MALKGDLASVDLAQVFQMLALNRKVGLLSVQGPGVWKALYFNPRGVTLYYNEHLLLDKVLGNMVRSGHLSAQSVRGTREHAANTGHTLVESLLAGGFVTEPELESAFRIEMEEEIYDLFFWKDARFEFYEGQTALEEGKGVINERFFFSTDTLIMEAARRIDEWAFIKERVPGPEEIFRAIEDQTNVIDFLDSALAVYELVDGKRNVERLIEVTALSAFHVYKSLAHLLEQGMIEPTQSDELVAAAQECVSEGRLQDAINLYERAISFEEGLPDTHVHVAGAYEAIEEYENSAQHLKRVAEYYAAEDDVNGAAGILRQVIEMMPTDLEARERFVELTVGVQEFKSDDIDPVAEGKVLVDLYLELGEIDRVRGILERLLRDNPDDIELKKSLINVHTKAGDSRRVIELYESIAEDLVSKGEPIEAVKYLQKILMIDRARKEVSDRIRTLYEMDERRRSRRRTIIAFVVIVCILAVLGGVWFFYERHAREHFDHLDVTQLVQAKEFSAAESIYKSFIESYPLTLVSRDAEAELVRIESARLAHEAQIKQQRIREDAQRNRKRAEYRAEWKSYQAEAATQDLAAALSHLENVKRMVAAIEDPADQRWAEEVRLEKNLNDLRVYIGEAAALERSSRDLLARNDWRGARVKLLELTNRYEITEVAKRARVPVLLTSSPAGAAIYDGGRQLMAVVDGQDVPLVTPAVVFCQPTELHEFELRQNGFRPLRLSVNAKAAAESHHVMTIVPSAVTEFEGAVQTGVGAWRGHVAVGLRGGKFGLAGAGGQPMSIQLPGLREVQDTPVVAVDRVFVVTNANELICYPFAGGAPHYTIQLQSHPAHEMIGKDGRLVFASEQGELVCIDMTRGQVLWSKRVPGELAGDPTVNGRRVRVGTRAGELFVYDVTDGARLQYHGDLSEITSSVRSAGHSAIFARGGGHITAVNEDTGRASWSTEVGVVKDPNHLLVVDDSALVITGSTTLSRLDLENGSVKARFELPGRAQSMVSLGRRVFISVREELGEVEYRGLLLAVDAGDLRVLWEFRDGGTFLGPVTTDGTAVYLPGSDATVLRFR